MRRGLVILLATIACSSGDDSVPKAKPGTSLSTVVTPPPAAPSRGHIGVLVAKESVNVPTLAPGIVRTVLVDIGDSVIAGQAIATMDSQAMKSELVIASANARASAARAKRLRVEMAAAQVLARRQTEMGTGIISRQEIEAAKTKAASSAAAFSEASAESSAQKGRVSQLRHQLSQTTVKAPFAGKIAQRLVTPGAAVGVGAPIVLLITAETLQVDFVVPLGEQSSYKLGDRIRVTLDRGERSFEGIVRRIAPNIDSVTQMTTMQADLAPDEAVETLQAGIGVWVSPAIARDQDDTLAP